MDGVLAGAAAELEHPLAGHGAGVEAPPHRGPHPGAQRAVGEGRVVVAGQVVEGVGRGHCPDSMARWADEAPEVPNER